MIDKVKLTVAYEEKLTNAEREGTSDEIAYAIGALETAENILHELGTCGEYEYYDKSDKLCINQIAGSFLVSEDWFCGDFESVAEDSP
jgi:hypothetical protein